MKSRPTAASIGLLTVALAASLAMGQARRANINLAEARFRLGEFALAGEMAATVLETDPENLRAVLLQAKLALLANRLEDAAALARRALEIRPTHRLPTEILAEAEYRRGEFASAAVLLAALGRETTAAKLASFEDRHPYATEPARGRIPFAKADPVPIFRVSVNGAPPALFALDTQAGEVGIDASWAAEIGIADFGVEKSPGGRTVGHGRADTLDFEGFQIRDVPVTLLSQPPQVATGSGERVRGVLGATLLSRFRATIDYPGARLVLEPRSPGAAEADDPSLLARIPFYFTIENSIVARGRINDTDSLLLLVALGDASLGFTSPRSTLDEARVELLEEPSGASSAAIPYLLESLSLGELRRAQVPGVHGLFPPRLEHDRGFRIGGLVADGFLRPYAVTFDFDAMELLIRQPPD